MHVYFYLKGGFLYCRINNGQGSVKAVSTKIKLLDSQFIQKHQIATDPIINKRIDNWKVKSHQCSTIESFLLILKSKSDTYMVSECVTLYIDSRPNLSRASLQKYNALKRIIIKFSDIPIDALDNKYAMDFFAYCRGWMGQNSAVQRMKQLKQFVQYAVDVEIIHRNKIIYNPKKEIKPIIYLSQDEVDRISNKKMGVRLAVIRDVFVFQIYTAMEYSRVKELKPSDIVDVNGKLWAKTVRKKSNKHANVRLLPPAIRLIDKYKGEELCFPVRTNAKMNEYLKEISDICDIEKELHTHIARHTFATTISLLNGVSAEATASQMGISLVMLFKRYGQITSRRVEDDTDMLFDKFS